MFEGDKEKSFKMSEGEDDNLITQQTEGDLNDD